MRFLIAGLGSIGRRHLRNLIALGERDIVLFHTGRSTLPEAELAGFPVATELDAALEYRPDAVIVANPTALHLDVAIPAALAGCHLLIEKPVSHSLQRIDRLQAAAATKAQVLVGFQYRFHPGLQRLRQWVREEAAGPALFVRAHYGDYLPQWHPWEDYRASYSAQSALGGGALLTLCHPVDTLMWIFGDPTLRWAATRRAPHLDVEVEAIAELGLDFPHGVLAGIHLDFVQQPPDHHVEVLAQGGTLRWSQLDGAAGLWRAGSPTAAVSFVPDGFERNDMFLEELRHFRAIVGGEAEPMCSLEEGIRSLSIVLDARSLAGVDPETLGRS
jgi:predicted dehydrogenase